MSIDRVNPGTQIIYVPSHAEGDLEHPDCEEGFVTSQEGGTVWCRFWSKQPGHENELRTKANSEGTPSDRLAVVDTRPQSVVERACLEIDEIWNEWGGATLGEHDPRFA